MKKLSVFLLATALVFGLNTNAVAHDPPDFLGFVWQWSDDTIPVLDGDISEFNIIPEEFWVTSEFADQNGNTSADRADGYDGPLDAASLSYRWVATWVDSENRIYFGHDRFDDVWWPWDDIEIAIDADHSGGNFWNLEDQTDEEIQRTRGRHAQIYHLFFDDGLARGPGIWSWFWMTQADWYDVPPYSDKAYTYTGEPGDGNEWTLEAEWYNVVWDDYNWLDPEGSIEHDLTEGEVIGMANNVWDHDTLPGGDTNECACAGRWSLSPNVESFGDADFFADFLMMPIDEEILSTAVEDNTWGQIKASMAR